MSIVANISPAGSVTQSRYAGSEPNLVEFAEGDAIGIFVDQFQSPDEVADLVRSSSNPLESQFSPGYSMVLNLLQNLELDQAKELILKSFGYFSSNDRLKPIIMQQLNCEQTIAKLKNEKCPHGLTNEDFIEFNKLKDKFINKHKKYF